MTEKPYEVPDPHRNPGAFLVVLYKVLQRVEYNDRNWDEIYFARGMKRTKQLLEIMHGDVQRAAQCMQELKEYFEGENLNWKLETIIQYSFEWRSKNEHRSGKDCLRGLWEAYKATGAESGIVKALQEPEKVLPVTLREPEVEPTEEERQGALAALARVKAILKKNEKPINKEAI